MFGNNSVKKVPNEASLIFADGYRAHPFILSISLEIKHSWNDECKNFLTFKRFIFPFFHLNIPDMECVVSMFE